jgi:N utilization substance protein A
MAIQSEFLLAINQIAAERGIDIESVLTAVEFAISAAYKKDHAVVEEDEVTATIDRETGDMRVFVNGKEVSSEGFGRIAAQTAKQVIFQKIREAEKESMIKDFEGKVGTIETANVQRMAGPDVIVEMGKATALLPASEQIKSERYRSGQKFKVYILGIDKTTAGGNIIVSRNTPLILQALFENEVPEISNGSVDIKALAREAGSRSKVAVTSNVEGIDPIGSCVGQRGIRIDAIMNELGNEKVDIIEWDPEIAKFIKNALSPAKPIAITIDETTKSATVVVADDQQSLAIGKEGQNVRLAAKLTGWDIDIIGESEVGKEKEKKGTKKEEVAEDTANELGDIDPAIKKKLLKEGITTKEQLAHVISGELKVKGVGPKALEALKA